MAIQTMKTVIDNRTSMPWMDDGYVGDFAVRQMRCTKTIPHEGHAHWIDHISVITKGPVRIEWSDPDGTSGTIDILVAPWVINIPAERHHKFVALGDEARWFCIFSGAHADEKGIQRSDFNYERLTHG